MPYLQRYKHVVVMRKRRDMRDFSYRRATRRPCENKVANRPYLMNKLCKEGCLHIMKRPPAWLR